jgi:O-antigen/teichoic acid export membrane protein
MLVSGSNFVLGILLARYLGVEGYGQFALLWLIVLFFSSLQLAYIVSPMLTLGSKKSFFITDRYLSTMMFLQLLFTLIAILSLYFFLEIAVVFDEKWDMGDLKIYIIFTTLFFLSQDFLRRYFIIKTQYYKLVLIDAIAYIGQLGMIVYFIYNNNLELSTALLAVSIPFLLSLSVGYTQVTRVTTDIQYKKLVFLKNWNFSKWLVYSAILQWGSGNFFILAGGAILGSWSVGVIRVMQNTMGVFHVLFIALENILPINFSKIYSKNGYASMINYFNKQLKYGAVIFAI